eukprot:CAMPEP_0170495328 /NCGR_PEP_ID=MMETSP0208-20121228/15141_1 /TAXON_ID=197538 /ORGANISM="Strombidium inclinatum, Strain S3" /LENGTH=107 /DNA_ID=CAMNT_0010771501 /DNA_START=1286 /DNA_END=1609 /DNA_ORIENTATION=-
MEHDVLQLEVTVDDQDLHHVEETADQLVHYFLDDPRIELPALVLHQIFEIASVAELHEDVVPGVSFDSFPHPDHVLALHRVLVLDLAHNQPLFGLAEAGTLHHFTGV